jgi:signal transduction histidine kinase
VAAVVSGSCHQIEFGNAAFLRLFGSDRGDGSVKEPPQLADRRLSARVDEVLASGRGRRIRGVRVRPPAPNGRAAGGVRYFDLVLEPAHGDPIRASSVLVVGVEVTGRVRKEQRLRAQQRQYAKLLQATATRIWLADVQGRHVRETRSGELLTPLDPAAAADDVAASGAVCRPVSAPGSGPAIFPAPSRAWHDAVREGTLFAATRRVVMPDGEHWMLTRAVPAADRSGTVRHWLGLDIDVTDHVDALLAMRVPVECPVAVADGHLGHAVESQQRLVRGFGHDIRNALHAADGHAQILENMLFGPLTCEQLQSVARLRGLLHSAAALVADVLRAARAESEPPVVSPVPTDLLAIVIEAVEGQSAAAVLKKLDLTLEHSDELFWTHTDPARVRQALDNLLSNAVKFTEHGSIAVRIHRQTGREPGDGRDWIAISVSDTGPGIPASSRASVFEEFVRLRPSAHEGVGIGLSISRRIAELIGATITLESEEGRGSVFTLWLPVEYLPADESDRRP